MSKIRILVCLPCMFSREFHEFLTNNCNDVSYINTQDEFDRASGFNFVFCRFGFLFDSEFLERNPNMTAVFTVTTADTHCRKVIDAGIPVLKLEPEDELRSITSSSEHALLLTMALSRQSFKASDKKKHVGVDLSQLRVGILGGGRIGLNLFKWLSPICSQDVLVLDRCAHKARNLLSDRFDDIDLLIVSITAEKENFNLINEKFLRNNGNPEYLVNISRGEVVDEAVIKTMILNGSLRGYATDVLKAENSLSIPDLDFAKWMKTNSNGKSCYNLVLTSHIGGLSSTSVRLADEIIIRKARNWL